MRFWKESIKANAMFRAHRILLCEKSRPEKKVLRCMSVDTGNLTFDTLFNDTNKTRVQKKLDQVKPARSAKSYQKLAAKRAAVLVPLCTVAGVPSILFTLRSSKLSRHKGEVSFPGGIHESNDRDLIHTAVREAEEELGLSSNLVDVWGKMTTVPGKDFKTMVTPVLSHIGAVDIESFCYNHSEVEEVFSRSIESLCSPENVRYTRYRSRSGYTLPVYLGGVYRIWGLSAIILHMTLLALVPPPLYNFKLQHR